MNARPRWENRHVYGKNASGVLQAAKDPIFFRGGQANLYVYVGNDPLNYVDPLGLEVTVWKRPAELPLIGGFVDHYWIKTDKYEAGMGPITGDIPGQGGQSSLPGDPTKTVNHSGQSKQPNAEQVPLPFPVDEQCVNEMIKPGRLLGPWTTSNQCQSFVGDVINKCSHVNKGLFGD